MATALDELIQAPDLPQQVERLCTILDDERKRRQRFYEQATEDGKWEFINGETVMQSPARWVHSEVSEFLHVLLATYARKHDLGVVRHEKTLITLPRNDYEPDVCFFSKEKASAFAPDQWQFPAPDFIAEVLSDSTEAIDRGVKFVDYAANGVREYWIVDPVAQILEKYIAREGRYELDVKVREGEIESSAVQGFRVPVRALVDRAANFEALRGIMLG
jgi:Uma2 family endonuclease